jgi:hypothetical protein
MLFDRAEPISVPCAQTVEPAINSLLRLGIVQEEFVEHVTRALGIVRCVVDHQQSIPRKKLAALGRSLWTRVPHIPNVPNDAIEQVRSIIMACVAELREVPESSTALSDAALLSAPANSASAQPDHPGQAIAFKEPQVTDSHATQSVAPVQPPNGNDQPNDGYWHGTTGLFGTLPPQTRPRSFSRNTDRTSRAPYKLPPSQRQRSLFDSPTNRGEPDLPVSPVSSGNGEPYPPTADNTANTRAVDETRTEQELAPPRLEIASGERAKARDILAAVRALKSIEREGRSALPEERDALARFAGFGPVALSIFPNAVSGRYKDASWQQIGEELKAALTPGEYDSAKRTTFNAFYTSPTVISATHEAIARLGVPADATVLEPGCGIGSRAPASARGGGRPE